MNTATYTDTVSRKQILISTAIALVVSVILLFTAVMPAEFNRDPLGTGKLLGIGGMTAENTDALAALNKQSLAYHNDTYKIVLAPFESLEYKYRLAENATIVFDWQATGEVLFDMHSEKDGVDPEEYSPSFDQRKSTGEKGSFTAPFSGIHGWFWENQTTKEVEIVLNSVGFYEKSKEFRDGYVNEKKFK